MIIVASAVAVSACSSGGSASPHPIVLRTYHGIPSGAVTQHPGFAGVIKPIAAFTSATTLSLTTWGSGSCPTVPTSLTVVDRTHLYVRTASSARAGSACTADLGPTTSEIAISPDKIDTAGEVHVQVVLDHVGPGAPGDSVSVIAQRPDR